MGAHQPLALAFLALAAAGCSNASTSQAVRIGDAFLATPVAQFDEPWAMTFLPDGRLLVTEKKGALKLLDPGSGKQGDIAGVPKVAYGGQGGFGDVILHPDFARNQLVYVSFAEPGEDGASGRNVFILTQDGTKESVTTARSGQLLNQGDDKVLVLEHGQRNDVDAKAGEKTMASFERYSVLAWEKAVKRADDRPPKARTTMELLRDPNLRNQAELSWRFGLLLGAGNLMLLGIGLSATNPRRPNNWNLLFALLGFVVYYNLVNLTGAWVGAGRVGLGMALFGLHGTAFVMALALIRWRDRAATSRRPRAAKALAA